MSKGCRGRKTDIQDCQCCNNLHSVGLLRGSFRPTGCRLCGSQHSAPPRQPSSRAPRARCCSCKRPHPDEPPGCTMSSATLLESVGWPYIDSILLGEREPSKLSGLCDGASKPAAGGGQKSGGRYRPEHLFCLHRPWKATGIFRIRLPLATSISRQMLARFDSQEQCAEAPSANTKPRQSARPFDVPSEMHRILGGI